MLHWFIEIYSLRHSLKLSLMRLVSNESLPSLKTSSGPHFFSFFNVAMVAAISISNSLSSTNYRVVGFQSSVLFWKVSTSSVDWLRFPFSVSSIILKLLQFFVFFDNMFFNSFIYRWQINIWSRSFRYMAQSFFSNGAIFTHVFVLDIACNIGLSITQFYCFNSVIILENNLRKCK